METRRSSRQRITIIIRYYHHRYYYIIGGGGRRVLGIAAREADIVGVNPSLAAGYVGPEVLETTTAEYYDQRIAWIREAAGDRFADLELQVLTFLVQIVPDRACDNKIALCAKGIGPEGAAQCHGDSGGPLVVYDKSKPTLIGLVSHNQGATACGENPRPGVFTRIAPFREWIESKTGKLQAPVIKLQAKMLPPSAAPGN